ncbi:DUF6177 family protein [Frigoribacterium sp. 2-23]|uniref:DUF6177 family protein n=1 Tax=Frigoribacterium sp. 2-23 TaxID=3415006 RepID=UPI003C6FB192
MGTSIRHPLVDAVTPRVVRVDSRARVVRLSKPLARMLRRPSRRRRIVLVTDERSRVTIGLRAALVAAGGVWAVRDESGDLRDGLTGIHYADLDAAGYALDDLPDLDASAAALPVVVADAVDTTCQVSVDLTVLHRASHDTTLGGALETLSAAVSGTGPTHFGESEPLVHRWDRWVLTQQARHVSPESMSVVVEGPTVSATITARVTEHGVEETTAMTVDVGDGGDAPALDAAIARLSDALAEISTTSLPTFALVVARQGEPDRSVRAVTYPPPNPVVLLIGAPSVRRLGIELAAVQQGRPVRVVGRPRLPAYVVPLGDAENPGWDALHQTLDAVGPERLATMVTPPLLQAWEDDLHEMDLLHESSLPGATHGRPDGAADDEGDEPDDAAGSAPTDRSPNTPTESPDAP